MNSFDVVARFEECVAKFAGSRYAVATNTGTSALFLSLMYFADGTKTEITVPAHTFISVPMACLQAGYRIKFEDKSWYGTYHLKPLMIIDGALRFRKGMYFGGLHCLSFHARKLLNIGEGGTNRVHENLGWSAAPLRLDRDGEAPLRNAEAVLNVRPRDPADEARDVENGRHEDEAEKGCAPGAPVARGERLHEGGAPSAASVRTKGAARETRLAFALSVSRARSQRRGRPPAARERGAPRRIPPPRARTMLRTRSPTRARSASRLSGLPRRRPSRPPT